MISIEIPDETLQRFCERYKIRRMALFGSALRDDFRPDSDVDLLVVFEPSARVTFMTLGSMKRELSNLFNRSVDIVPQAGLKPAIREEVIASSKELYAA